LYRSSLLSAIANIILEEAVFAAAWAAQHVAIAT